MRSLSIILLVIALLCTSCGKAAAPPPERPAVSEEVVTYLIELNDKAMQEMTAKIADLDKQIAEIEEKETYLHEIKSKIDREIIYSEEKMAEMKEKIGRYWIWSVPEENLKSFENKCYQLVKFELVYTGAEGTHFDEISIMDKETGETATPESFETDLREIKKIYANRKTIKLKAQQEANQILSDVLQSKDTWKVNERDNGVYSISGYGLGYTDQLSIGEWYYYESSKTIEPMSAASIRLKDAIIGK